MDEANDLIGEEEPQQDHGPLIPTEPVAPITSRFLFVDVAALRAKQLRRGARLRIIGGEPLHVYKPERLAMEEVKRGLVAYDVPPPVAPAANDGGDRS